MEEQYRNEKDCRYFASDLNKFVNENCTKKITAGNIDLFMFLIKRNEERTIFIESKHSEEHENTAQIRAFRYFVEKYKLPFYLVRGDYPYDIVDIIKLAATEDKDIKITITNQELFKKFLECEVSFFELGDN